MNEGVTPAMAATRTTWLAGLALAVLTMAAWWPALSAGFVSDDFIILQRLADHGGLADPLSYFGLRHFEYYRPLAFIHLAANWQFFGRDPAGYHAVALAIHLVNTLLVFVMSRRLMGAAGAVAAGAVFALHPASHEAVVWMSARFDLMATAWLLIGLLVAQWRRGAADVLAAAAFLIAILCKESTIGLPVVVISAVVLLREARAGRVLRLIAYFAGAAVIYTVLRQGAGLPAMGGAARMPKLAALTGLVGFALAIAQLGWPRVSAAVTARRRLLGGSAAVVVVASAALGWAGPIAPTIRGAYDSIAFAGVHLLSPVNVDHMVGTLPHTAWLLGVVLTAGLVAAVLTGWRRVSDNPDIAFLILFLVAVLIPVSSMTEGTRYLYLATAPAAMLAGRLIESLAARRSPAVAAVVVAVLAVNVWQIESKIGDWRWASRMTERAVSVIAGPDGTSCAGRDVVLLTAPVRVHGVYSNLNLEALKWLGGCAPASFNTVVRVGLDAPTIRSVRHTGQGLTFTATDYTGGFVTSRDWRTFDVRLAGDEPTTLSCPMGTFDAVKENADLRMRLTFAPGQPPRRVWWFYFSQGALDAVPVPPQ